MTPSDIKPLLPVHFSKEELDAELEELLKDPVVDNSDKDKTKNIILSSVDAIAADNGSKKTQDQWFDYYTGIKDGRIMASMGDLYQYFKKLKQESGGTSQQKTAVQTALVSLRDDFSGSNWLIAGTRMIYQADNENSKIVQHYRCSKPTLVKETTLPIPVYLGVPIVDVSRDSRGLKYLQALHDTVDPAETIISTLEFVSDKKRAEIKVWTPPLQEGTSYTTRKASLERAAGFNCYGGGFHVDGDYIGNTGRSRGVRS
jgi:hypothetical protein